MGGSFPAGAMYSLGWRIRTCCQNSPNSLPDRENIEKHREGMFWGGLGDTFRRFWGRLLGHVWELFSEVFGRFLGR